MNMTDNELIYVSVILQLLYDGKADTSPLSPTIKKFLQGIIEEYEDDPSDPLNEQLYYACNTMLESDIKDYH
jgi:hypothetical protein